MADLVRLSITMENDLYNLLEELLEKGTISNRSEFIRDLIRTRLVELEWEDDSEVIGTITFVYNHSSSDLLHQLTHIQHDDHNMVLVNTHLHLSHDLCAEVIVARGMASDIRKMTDKIRQNKAVIHASLSISTTGMEVV